MSEAVLLAFIMMTAPGARAEIVTFRPQPEWQKKRISAPILS
jgi:hypothetical protein